MVSNVPSWGFSGGAHMAAGMVNGKVQFSMLGMISHFQYLSEQTIVIPTGHALMTSKEF